MQVMQNTPYLSYTIDPQTSTQTLLTDEPRLGGEISDGNRDGLCDVLTHDLNVVLELSRYGNDGSSFRNRTCE